MSNGLLALLDDVVALTKVAATSLDDASAQIGKASSKAAGVVIDDAAVTPKYVVGFTPDRELPIIAKITLGSLKNKLLILLPAALILSSFAPWAILPLLMCGGFYLAFEGFEKVHHWYETYKGSEEHHESEEEKETLTEGCTSKEEFEKKKISSAIRTDLILSAEIMAITLSTVAEETQSIVEQGLLLAVVGILITIAVYGTVALIVKMDDIGLALSRQTRPLQSLMGLRKIETPQTKYDMICSPIVQTIGRGLVLGMPKLLNVLSVIGTLAMLWVGGGIILHGIEHYLGFHSKDILINALGTWSVLEIPASILISSLIGVISGGILMSLISIPNLFKKTS